MTTSARRRFVARVALVVAALALTSACGSARLARRLDLPPDTRLYVAVFVDETEEGRVGVPLADAVRVEVYRRDPARLAMSFDEGTWALDGTVLALVERQDERGRMQLTVKARARVLDKRGDVVAALGNLESAASYRVSKERVETEQRRADALEDAVRDLARELVRRVERAAEAPSATTTDADSGGGEGG